MDKEQKTISLADQQKIAAVALMIVNISTVFLEALEEIDGDIETYPVVEYLRKLTDKTEDPLKKIMKAFTASVHTAEIQYRVNGFSEQTFREIESLIERDLRDIKKTKFRTISKGNVLEMRGRLS